jgi:hypothetical protein
VAGLSENVFKILKIKPIIPSKIEDNIFVINKIILEKIFSM